ncbi:YkvA family protein [Streptomyces tropicalis]|uniref:YkvA family protein n=1 Tax=Streptomyces tropicalis TaxID=3034234 RepID=A0ABT6AE42_9ACTN|nr:YkvA family protein [Streptomyces tropicalis]MDF3302904.1 YkvA family protein [Streptomyces tropicalis]
MDHTTEVILVASVVAAVVLAVAVTLFVRLVRAHRALRRAGLPTGPRWVFWGAVLYFLLPFDLLPDPVYLDDVGVLLLALRVLHGATGDRSPVPSPRSGRTERQQPPGAADYAP